MKIAINRRNRLFLLVLISPFIDVINAIMHLTGFTGLSFGQVIRTVILVIMLYDIAKLNKKSFLYIFSLIFILIFKSLIYAVFFQTNFFQDLSCNFRYIYVMAFAFFLMGLINKKKIDRDDLFYLLKLYVGIIASISLVPVVTGFGIDYFGTKRIITEVNALTAILVIGIGIYLYELFYEDHSIKNIILTLIVVLATLSQATKTGIIGLIVLGVYLYIYTGVVRKKLLKQLLISIVVIGIMPIIYNYYITGSGNNILNRWSYFYAKMNVWSFLLSGRDEMLATTFDIWKSNPIFILFGTGFSVLQKEVYSINATQSYIGAEMDFFDLFFYYGGIVGVCISTLFLKKIFNCIKIMFKGDKKTSYYSFLFIILFLISFLGAHVLSSPLAGILLCLMWGAIVLP